MDKICYWDDTEKVQKERDATPEEQAEIDANRAAAVSLAALRQWEAIKQLRDARILQGGFPVGPHWFHSDLISRSQFLAAARRADLVAASGGDMNAILTNSEGNAIAVKTMDNGHVPVTASLAHTIMSAAELQESNTYKVALQHKAGMEAAENPASYDYKTGWPPIFGE
ncbi:DUF4376 domain-containing protein [Massilia endophytica]|uniref:DUF4376 domain-containing protein n=1 Tax=Massilia endophytica TaxID=2899220 RepID=UPI001E4F03D2|nr:DUF4376 domain-containing protein [Massilia endophytica]UGQ44979.1 DUF4376 domain-containing protein [Massilia endophytica]